MVNQKTIDILNAYGFMNKEMRDDIDLADKKKINRIIKRLQKKYEYKYQAEKICHTLSDVSKMPFKSYNIPAEYCNVGSKMKKQHEEKTLEEKIIGKDGNILPACVECYGDGRNNYAFTNVKEATEKRYRSLFHKDWVPAMIKLLLHNQNTNGMTHFRWHDVGDLQGVWHLKNIIAVVVCTPNIKHWLPTLETTVLRDYLAVMKGLLDIDYDLKFNTIENLNIRISTPIINGFPLTEISKGLGCTSSLVESSDRILAKNMEEFMENSICTSTLHENECKDCRKCWEKECPLVRYPFKKNGLINGKVKPIDLNGGQKNV